ncbi:LPS assembly protein LptD [Sulfurimonas sp. HSL3-7]|uniref:LPS-assembly protein LptD n=1 Tax=Sulfonitrofixus jiaomeiensis TaxID=3131938 RepID=UPI0031F96ED5
MTRRLELWWSMHLRYLLLFFFLTPILYAGDPVEFYAKDLNMHGDKVYAEGDVLVIYQDSYISAEKASYDKNSTVLELFGNVVTLKGSEYQFIGDYMKLNIDRKEREISPFYMLDKESKVWLSSQKSQACENTVNIEKGIISGCEPSNPLWEIYFSSSDYNSESKWLNIYNARFHFGGIPLLYFPYFGYSLDRSRRSGLLIPSFGVSGSEGLYYEQPLYIVLGDSADIELKPQLRTSRGQGLYGTLRFVDSKDSRGSLTLGYFEEKNSYFLENNLQNDRHYGFGFKYQNRSVLQHWFGLDLGGQSGLYSDVQWMNDVDYLNLSSNDTINSVTSNQVYSRVNLFYNEEKNYYGAYLKYYLDLNPQDADKRKATIQKLPILQYHHYLDAYLDQHLYYTLNMTANNYVRQEGKEGEELELNIPVTLQSAFLDDYINVAYKAQLYGRLIDFRSEADASVTQDIYKRGYYGRLSHNVNVDSYLTKGYEEYSHTMVFSGTYTKFGSDKKGGYYALVENDCTSDLPLYPQNCEFYTLSNIEDNVNLQFTQYIIDNSGREKIYHRLSQPVLLTTSNSQEEGLGDFENEFRWNITDKISFYDDTFYSFQRNEWVKTLNTLRYQDKAFNIGFSYLYENKAYKDKLNPYTNYLNADASYRYNKHYKYFTKYAFDVENSIKKYSEIGFLYTKRCWDFGLRYVENNRPVLRQNSITDSTFDKYIYFTLILKPIGGSEVSYRTSDTLTSQ